MAPVRQGMRVLEQKVRQVEHHKKTLGNAQRCKRYKQKIRADPGALVEWKQKKKDYNRKYEEKMRSVSSEEKKAAKREANRLSQQRRRERQKKKGRKAQKCQKPERKVKTRKQTQNELEKKEKARLRQQKRRRIMHPQKRRRENEKRMQRYYRSKSEKGNDTPKATPNGKVKLAYLLKGINVSLKNNRSKLAIFKKDFVKKLIDREACMSVNLKITYYRSRKPSYTTSVQRFYERAGVDYPGKKGSHIKKVLTKSMGDLFKEYRKQHPNVKVSFTTFKRRRPQNIVLSSSRKFNQCLCEKCVNVMLLMNLVNPFLKDKSEEGGLDEKATCVDHVLNKTLCDSLTRKCIERECSKCGIEKFISAVKEQVKDSMDVERESKRWEKTERMNRDLVCKKKTMRLVIETLEKDLRGLAKHLEVAKWQRKRYQNLTENVPLGHAVLTVDFAENYLCKFQDQVQSAHWSYRQVTVHPCLFHFQCPNASCDSIVKEYLVFLSDDLNHDSGFTKHVLDICVQHIKAKGFVALHIFSDGCAAQYKSAPNFFNLTELQRQHVDITLSRHYFGSSHGKSLCDSCGGTVKSKATQAVASGEVSIQNAQELYDFCTSKVNIDLNGNDTCCSHILRSFHLVEKADVKRCSNNFKSVKGTHGFHCVKPSAACGYLQAKSMSCFCSVCLVGAEGVCLNEDFTLPWSGIKVEQKKKPKVTTAVSAPSLDDAILYSPETSVCDCDVQSEPVDRQSFFHDLQSQFAACISFVELQSLVDKVLLEFGKYPLPSLKSRTVVEVGGVVDKIALALRPPGMEHLFPLLTTADGNCVPRTFSILMFGSEDYHIEVRCRIVAELVVNSLDYLCLSKNELNFLMEHSDFMSVNVQMTFQLETLDVSKSGKFMGLWQLMAASNVFNAQVISVYPHHGPHLYRSMYNRLLKPRETSGSDSDSSLVIFWSSTRNNDLCNDDKYWTANHVVPLLPMTSSSSSTPFTPGKDPGEAMHTLESATESVRELLVKIIVFLPHKSMKRAPQFKVISSDTFIVKATWLSPLELSETLKIHLKDSVMWLNSTILKSLIPATMFNPYLNVVAYASHNSLLPRKQGDLIIDKPLIMLRLEHRTSSTMEDLTKEHTKENNIFLMYPLGKLIPSYPGPNDTGTSLKMYRDMVKNDPQIEKLELKVRKDPSRQIVIQSDCVLLTFEAAMDLTVTLNFLSESLFHLLVTVRLEKGLKDMLPIVDEKSMILPRLKPEKFNEITQSRNGIYLPALTRKNIADLRTPKYYLLIRLQPSPQASKIDQSKWTEDVDSVLYSCLRLSCFLWEDSRLTSEDCKVSEFSAGAPQYLVCNCSRGNGFTGAVNDCSKTESRNIPMKNLEPLDPSFENLALLNWDITVVVVGLCMVFIALLFAVGFDKSDHLGKTYALPGTFSPVAEDHYLVCIVTGPGFYSSTDCSPLLILVGSKANSRVYILDIDSKPFQANSEIWLAVSSSYPLGQLQGVILSLGNDGEKQSWFVSQVFIRQAGTDDEYLFVFDCWVREPMRNKNYGVEIVSSVEGELIHLCLRYFSRMFLIYHMIAGTIKTFPGSPFSKSQHVLYTFYSLMMLMNIVQLIEYQPHQTLQGDLESESRFRPSTEGYAESLLYGLIGALVSLPIGIIMAGMWRKSRIKVAWPNHLRFVGEKQPVVPPRAREQKIIWSVIDVDDTKTVLPIGLINFEEDMGSEVDATETNMSANASVVSAQTSFDVRPESSRSSVSRATTSKSVSSSSTFSRKDKVEFTGDGNFKFRPSAIHGDIVNRVQLRKRWYRLTSATLLPYLVIGFLFIPVLPLSFSTCWKSLYFSKTESKGFLFHFFMAASFMYILAVPFLLFLGALFFSLMASAGKGYYGPRHEADDRMCYLRTYFPIMAFLATRFESDTRNRTVGYDQEPEIGETEKMWASKWCKWKFAVLTHTRKKYYKPRKKDQTIEAILFLIVIVVIINYQSGGIFEKYLQTQYLANYLNFETDYFLSDKPFDDDVFWNETDKILEKLLQLMNPVKQEQLTELHVLGAVVLQQVRVKSYSGDCAKEYPDLIDPECHFTLDEMPIEDRNFAGSWDKLKRGTACKLNAFTFCSVAQHAEMGVSMDDMFSAGGYFALFSVQDKTKYPSISKLKSSLWVDQNTRGMLLSLTILNGGTNYVTSLKRFYSFDSNTGAIMASSKVYTFQLYYKRTAQQVLIFFGMLFCALTMCFLGVQIIRLHEEGIIRYFSHHESWIVLIERIGGILVCSFTFLFLKQREVDLAKMKEIYVREEEGETIISLDTLAGITYWILMFTSLTGVTCFIHILVTFREFDILRKFIDLIPKTFRLFFMPYIASVAFAFLGLLWFVHFKEFSTFSSSNVIVFVLMLKPNLIADIIQIYPYIGKIYLFFLYWIMFYIILNYFLSSIMTIYSEIKMSIIHEKASKTNLSASEGYDSAEL